MFIRSFGIMESTPVNPTVKPFPLAPLRRMAKRSLQSFFDVEHQRMVERREMEKMEEVTPKRGFRSPSPEDIFREMPDSRKKLKF